MNRYAWDRDDMGEILAGIANFLRLNARTAFALFAAYVTLWLLRRYALIGNEPAELTIAYLAAFGLFVFFGIVVEGSFTRVQGWWQRRAEKRAQARQKKQDAEDARVTALANLYHLENAELDALKWIYHRNLGRVRANQGIDVVGNLVRMKILIVENNHLQYHDRFFLVPDYVDETLAEIFGLRDANGVGANPPWLERRP